MKKQEELKGIFIAMPARIMAILQLCLAFTVIAWFIAAPFTETLYTTKSKLMVYQHVMGTKNSLHAQRFSQLPPGEKNDILNDAEMLLQKMNRPFSEKISESLSILLFASPSTFRVWLFFSILIPILLLKRVEGSIEAVWILPIAMFCFAIDNSWHGKKTLNSPDESLFPSEQRIVQDYLQHPLSTNILEQHAQLSKGWDIYLIREWAKEMPSMDPLIFKIQKEKGDFFFHLARLKLLKPALILPKEKNTKNSSYLLSLALFWQILWAMLIWKTLRQKQKQPDPGKVPN